MRQAVVTPVLPALAQVQTPTGATWYVPRTLRNGQFLVQRRYQGTGHVFYTSGGEEGTLYLQQERLVPLLIPYLNPGAVQAAGLELSAIMKWSAQHPEQIFSHPTYAPLCLRWGGNTHGYVVSALIQQEKADHVIFTPYTCWLTGQTYCQVDAERLPKPIFSALATQAGLLPHEQEIGLEGTWAGWYVLNIELATQALTSLNRQLVLACQHLFYGVWMHSGEAGEAWWLTLLTTAEEARTFYQRLPTVDDSAQASVTAAWGYTLDLPSRDPAWSSVAEKRIPLAYSEDLQLNLVWPYPGLLGLKQVSVGVAQAEVPLARRIPTLREVVNASAYSRWQLVQGLGWTLDKLAQVERRPWELTVAEVNQLAALLEVEEAEMCLNLRHELAAWKASQPNKL